MIVSSVMGKFRRDHDVAKTFEQVDHRKLHQFSGGRYLSIFCAAVVLAIVSLPSTQAQIVLGPSVNLGSLTNGQTIVVGDKAFTDFSIISTNFTASQVTVTGVQLGGNYGIEFSGSFLGGMSGTDLILGYQVSVTNSLNLISSANMLFNGTVPFGMGEASVTEQVFTNSPPSFYGQFVVFATPATNLLANSLAIIPPQSFLTISKDVSLEAVVPAFSEISQIYQTFTQVPEPSTVTLAVVGLAGLLMLGRRKR
jgi:hypothetical protein